MAAVTALLHEPAVAGVVLAGPAGVGKTALAATVAGVAEERGDVTVRLVATPAGAAVPFGALAGLGAIDPGDDATSDRAALRGAAERAVAQHLGDDAGPLLLVVDDVPLLDPGSADVLADLVRRRLVTLVATARTGQSLPPELDGLLVEGTVLRHPVAALDAATLRQAAEAALDGALHPDAAATLFATSAGIPLHARELVQANVAAGRLVPRTDGWTFVDTPLAPPSLLDLVTSRFGALADDQRQVFETLALAQPLPLGAATALAGVDALAALEQAELVTVADADGGPVVGLAHPLYDEAVRAELGPLQRRRAALRAAEALEALPHRSSDLTLRAACLRLDHDLPLAADQSVAAARRALALVDPHLAERLVRDAGDGFDACLVRGNALTAQGRVDEADTALRAALAAAGDDAERARVISRRGNNLGTRAGRFTEAIAVLEAGLAEVADERWRSFIAADLAYARLWAGTVAVPAEAGDAAAQPDAVRANECLVGAVVAVMQGELAAAEAFVTEGLPLAPLLRDDVPTARELLTLSRFLALAFGGDSARAAEVVAAELERATGQGEAGPGTWFAVRAMQRLYGGDAPGAIVDALDAEARLSAVDISGLQPLAVAVRATALAQLGDLNGSLAAAALVDDVWRDETKVRVQLAMGDAWRTVMAGHPRRAATSLVAAGAAALEANHVPFGAFAAHDAARLGHPRPALPVLRSAAQRWEGPLAAALLAHAELLDAGDAEGLLDLAPTLPPLGLTLSGAEAASQSARLFERIGSSTDARRAEFVAATLAQPLADVRSPTLGRPRGLTPREREIATLAADRQRSRDIAAALGISARTVDNHLAAVYQKLGVTNRSDLAAHLEHLAAS